ncbi:LPXTG cell wall anchor domain-containing protein [Bacillus pseudomycoides]|uniref:LPXTG cell wall anchor domain-containing protein n=1 Tax=Bacillus bingmayongensis TaxID=1150157 RepID=A0ABU5JXJ6_9BACI|nr:LPXTG cell wall anchor domain-containing protein [Bacillus pseudomycoides]
MNKLKWRSRIIFCFLAISACFLLAVGITKGAFFAKEQIIDSSQQRVGKDGPQTQKKGKFIGEETVIPPEKDSEVLYEIEDSPDFNKDGYYQKGDFKRTPRDRKVPNGGEEFLGGSTENIFIQIGIFVLVILFVFFIFRRKRNKKQQIHHISLKQKEIRKIGDDAEPEDQDSLILPAEEVRAMLIKWELTLPKFEKRRLQETVQQWFSRIRKNDHIIPVYEKVRYGEGTASNEELQMMRRWINENIKKSL